MWESAPRQFSGLIAARMVVALVPVIALAVAKQIVDQVLVSIGQGVVSPSMVRLIITEFVIVGIGAFALRLMSFLDALCAERFTLCASLKIMNHAAVIDQAAYEDPVFYDQLERARMQAVDRYVMVKAVGDVAQSTVLSISLIAGAATLLGVYVLLLVAATLPIFLIDSVFSLKWYSLRVGQTPDRRKLDYLRQVASSRESSKEVRLFDLSPMILRRFHQLAERLYGQTLALQRKKLLMDSLVIISTGGHYVVYGLIVFQTAAGTISLGTMTFLVGAMAGISRGVQELFVASTSVVDQSLFLSDLRHFLALKPSARAANPVPVPAAVEEGFEFHGVSFSYPGSIHKVVDRVSFRLMKGQRVALVGENGEGKTTIVKLLLRFYDPTEGRITLDGVDLREYDLADLYRHTGVIFQDFVRYEMTMRDNIQLGSDQSHANEEALENALQWSRGKSVADKLPEGLEQMLGRRFAGGVDLSGGEWQRLALARAYLRNSQLLILDEPNSALDAKAEREVFERLAELSVGRMVLFISHRFSSVRSASQILVLSRGAIAEKGTHETLMEHRGIYHRLFTLQAETYM
jgi:ATP-binding cassette subfamily B protein